MKKIYLLVLFCLRFGFASSQWVIQNPLPSFNTLYSIQFPTATTGYAVGYGGTIVKTNDAGATWTLLPSGTGCFLWSVYFTDSITGFAVGYDYDHANGIIMQTGNGGESWYTQTPGTPGALLSVCFADTNIGYISGEFGYLLKTTDGGATWNAVSTNTNMDLNSVFFTDAGTGFIACGDHSDGLILKTNNGGVTWSKFESGISEPLNSICFPDEYTGYAVGEQGTIFKTVSAGAGWTALSSGTTEWLKSIYVPDVNTGYAVGQVGTILKTVDGGTTWSPLNSGTDKELNSICFTDLNKGFAVGQDGIILKTETGGVQPPTLTVLPSERLVSPTAGTTYFNIYSGTGWVVSCDASWCNVTPSGSGNDSLIVTYSENTSSSSRIAKITVLSTLSDSVTVTVTQARPIIGMENTSEDNFKIFPNPNHGIFRISTGQFNEDQMDLTVQDLRGQVIIRKQLKGEKEYRIDLSTAPQGCYLLSLISDRRIKIQRLIIIN